MTSVTRNPRWSAVRGGSPPGAGSGDRRRFVGAGVALGLCALAALPGTASAQWKSSTGSSWNNPTSSLLDSMLHSQLNQQMMNQGRTVHEVLVPGEAPPGGPWPGAPAPAPPRPALPLTATDFRPAGRRIVPRRLADETPGASPAQKRELAALYERLLAQYEQVGRPHNVAGALAYLLATGSLVTGGQEPDDATVEAMIRHLNDALASTPAFARMPAVERQALYESVVIAAGFALNVYLQARMAGDAGQVQVARGIAETSVMQAFGRPLAGFVLTPGGIVVR